MQILQKWFTNVWMYKQEKQLKTKEKGKYSYLTNSPTKEMVYPRSAIMQ